MCSHVHYLVRHLMVDEITFLSTKNLGYKVRTSQPCKGTEVFFAWSHCSYRCAKWHTTRSKHSGQSWHKFRSLLLCSPFPSLVREYQLWSVQSEDWATWTIQGLWSRYVEWYAKLRSEVCTGKSRALLIHTVHIAYNTPPSHHHCYTWHHCYIRLLQIMSR